MLGSLHAQITSGDKTPCCCKEELLVGVDDTVVARTRELNGTVAASTHQSLAALASMLPWTKKLLHVCVSIRTVFNMANMKCVNWYDLYQVNALNQAKE